MRHHMRGEQDRGAARTRTDQYRDTSSLIEDVGGRLEPWVPAAAAISCGLGLGRYS